MKKLGIMIRLLISRITIQRVVLAFLDDTNLYSNKGNYIERIQIVINKYTRLFKVTGGGIQQTKSYCHR